MLDVRELRIGFGDKEIVKGISFNVNAGEIIGIIGESGSGKSMSALAVAGLLSKKAWCRGEINYKGTDLNTISNKARRKYKGEEISMIFQEPLTSLNPVMRIGKQVEEPLLIHEKLSAEERSRRVIEAMKAAGLKDPQELLDKYPHELSGGMRQRVMIAMALILEPSLMIADEPTTALDVVLQEQILTLLKNVVRKRNMATIFISHNMSIVRNFCDRVYVMHDGELVEEGTPEQIFSAPKEDYTRNLIASIPNGVLRKDKPSSKKCVLSVKDFSVFYKENKKHFYDKTSLFEVVKRVSLHVDEGEMVGLVGQSGCGKSSLSRGILGLQRKTSGEVVVYIDGRAVNMLDNKKDKHQHVQMVFQDPYSSLNPTKKIGWILEEPLRILHKELNAPARRARAMEYLKAVGLDEDIYERYPREISGGQRQRVSIALTLIQGASFIIADEPVSALDVTVSKQILDLFLDIQKRTGISVLFISHDMAIVRQMCHRAYKMADGRLTEITDMNEI